jgi:hypothetical protein
LVAASSKAAFKRDSLTKTGSFFFIYAFFTLLVFIFSTVPSKSQKCIALDEPVTQIKCLLSKIPFGIFNRNALQNEPQRCWISFGRAILKTNF